MAWPKSQPAPSVPRSAERLVAALRRGGDREEICRELHERYYKPTYGYFARQGFSPEECRDLTQETFLRLFRGLDGFRGRSRFETWLYEISVNVCRNELRDRSALKRDRREVSLEGGRENGGSSGALPLRSPEREPMDDLLAKEQLSLLRRELESLPPRMRRCLQLRLDQELKFREIAVLEQVSIDTVKSQLAQAKKRLRLRLGDYFGAAEARRGTT